MLDSRLHFGQSGVVTVNAGGSWQQRYDKSVAEEDLRRALEPSSLDTELASDNPRWWFVLNELRC